MSREKNKTKKPKLLNKREGESGNGVANITDTVIEKTSGGFPIAGFLKSNNYYGKIGAITAGLACSAGSVIAQDTMGQAIGSDLARKAQWAVAIAVLGWAVVRFQMLLAVARKQVEKNKELTRKERTAIGFGALLEKAVQTTQEYFTGANEAYMARESKAALPLPIGKRRI